jgi:hypothetical protein
MVERITGMIVINLGSEDNSSKLVTDEGPQASTTNELDNDMEIGTLEDDHNPNIRSAKQVNIYGTSNIVLPCPGS